MSASKIVLKDRTELYKIVGRVNTVGLEAVASQLQCDKSTLSRWLRKQGFTVRNVWGQTHVEKEAVKS